MSSKSPIHWLRIFFCGICIGTADMVPGVSGGTLAWMTGIYEEMLNSIKSVNLTTIGHLLRGRLRLFFANVAWRFLLALLCGIGTAFILFSHVLHYSLAHPIYRTYLFAAFFGLILASILYCSRLVSSWNSRRIAALVIGTALAWFLTSGAIPAPATTFDVSLPATHLSPTLQSTQLVNYNHETGIVHNVSERTLSAMLAKNVIDGNTPVTRYQEGSIESATAADFMSSHHFYQISPWTILCGAIAISAMLLPGISGAYLLTILGMYATVIGALADFTGALKQGAFDLDAFYVLSSLGIGILIGVVTFSRAISWLLTHYHCTAIALLTGFMIGALRAVWPFWTVAYALNPLKLHKDPKLQLVEPLLPDLANTTTLTAVTLGVIGFILVLGLESLTNRMKAAAE